jgi:hypothetical protein
MPSNEIVPCSEKWFKVSIADLISMPETEKFQLKSDTGVQVNTDSYAFSLRKGEEMSNIKLKGNVTAQPR